MENEYEKMAQALREASEIRQKLEDEANDTEAKLHHLRVQMKEQIRIINELRNRFVSMAFENKPAFEVQVDCLKIKTPDGEKTILSVDPAAVKISNGTIAQADITKLSAQINTETHARVNADQTLSARIDHLQTLLADKSAKRDEEIASAYKAVGEALLAAQNAHEATKLLKK